MHTGIQTATEMSLKELLGHMDAICKLHTERIGQYCPLVSFYPSVFTLLANYSVLQTQMNINQAAESAEAFPSVIKQ